MPVQSDGAEPVIAESGDSAEDTVSTQLHRNAGDKGWTAMGAGSCSVFIQEDSSNQAGHLSQTDRQTGLSSASNNAFEG